MIFKKKIMNLFNQTIDSLYPLLDLYQDKKASEKDIQSFILSSLSFLLPDHVYAFHYSTIDDLRRYFPSSIKNKKLHDLFFEMEKELSQFISEETREYLDANIEQKAKKIGLEIDPQWV